MRKTKIIAFFIIFPLIIVIFLKPVNVMIVKNYHTDEILLRQKIDTGYEFATLIKHSVHKTPVYEYYQVDKNGKIYITGTTLQDLGWGVPSTFDCDFEYKDNMMVLSNINEPIEFVPFRVSYIAKPHLILNNEVDIDLTKKVDNYKRIDIFVKKVPYIIYKMRGEMNVFQEKK